MAEINEVITPESTNAPAAPSSIVIQILSALWSSSLIRRQRTYINHWNVILMNYQAGWVEK